MTEEIKVFEPDHEGMMYETEYEGMPIQIIDKKKFIVFLNSSIIPFLIPIIIIIESNSTIEISIGFIYIIINNINVIIVNYII